MHVVLGRDTSPAPSPIAIWSVGLAVAYTGAGIGVAMVMELLERLVFEPLALGPRWGQAGGGGMLAVAVLAWGGLAAAGGGWLGRRLVRGLAPARGRAIAILTLGLILSATSASALHGHVPERFEASGLAVATPAILAVAALVALTLAAWARAALPPHRRRALGSIVLLAGAGFAAATLASLPDIADGVSTAGLALAATLAIDAVFVGAVVILGIVDASETPPA